jgi:hypothetical protein
MNYDWILLALFIITEFSLQSLSLFAIKQLSIPEFTTQQMYMNFQRILQDTKDTLHQGQGFRVNFVTC